jgi:hypothetical protein
MLSAMTDLRADADEDILPMAELSPADADGGGGRTQRVLGVAVAAILAVGLAVVALQLVGGDERTPEERLSAAPAAAEAAKTFAYEVKAESSIGSMSTAIDVEGVTDTATHRSQATMDLLGRKVEMVTDGTSIYLKVPAEARGMSQGKGWMKLPSAGIPTGGTTAASPTASPLETFRQLAAAGSDIEKVGEEDVRGTSTTHFRTRLDLSKQEGVGPLADQLTDVPVDVWLDDQDRPRRYRFTMTIAAPGQPQEVSVTTTIESFDFGKPVDIEVPDPADVADGNTAALGALFGGGGATGGS